MAQLNISERQAGDVTILDLSGEIRIGGGTTELRGAIRDRIAQGHNKILLNLKDVSYVDSSGLGELIMALGTVTQTICAKCGATVFKDDDGNWDPCPQCESKERKPWGELKLSNPGRQVMDLLQFTKLYSVFDVHDSEEQALTSFKSR